jgi:Flp pilus assembly protein TadG
MHAMNTLVRKLRRSRGAAAIEFAFTLPLLAFIVAAVIDWGSYMTLRVTVARGAMDGARAGAATREPTSVADGSLIVPAANQRTIDVMSGMNRPCVGPGCVVTSTFCAIGQGGNPCSSPPLQTIHVNVTYAYTPYFGFVTVPSQVNESFMMVVESQ